MCVAWEHTGGNQRRIHVANLGPDHLNEFYLMYVGGFRDEKGTCIGNCGLLGTVGTVGASV